MEKEKKEKKIKYKKNIKKHKKSTTPKWSGA